MTTALLALTCAGIVAVALVGWLVLRLRTGVKPADTSRGRLPG